MAWYEGIVHKIGLQRWLPDESDQAGVIKKPTELANTNIEKVKKEDVGKWVFDIADFAEYSRDEHYLNRNWRVARNLYNGDGWQDGTKEDRCPWRSRIVSNWCAEHVRSRASYVTSNNMTCYAYAVQAGDVQVADYVRDIIQHIFYVNSFNELDYAANIDASVTGTTYFKVSWDSDLNPPYGDVSIKHCEPSRIITDWDVDDMQQGRFAGEVFYMTEGEVKRLWPGKFSKIKDQFLLAEGRDNADLERPADTMRVVELYVLDRTTDKVVEVQEVENEAGVPEMMEVEMEVPRYENGRRIVVVEGTVVDDRPVGALLRQNFMRFPIIAMRGLVQPHEQYGKSCIIEYEPIVREIIKRESHISDILNLYAHPVVRAARGSFNNPQTEAVVGDDVLWEYNAMGGRPAPDIMTPPPGLLTGQLQQVSQLKGDFQFLSGMNDISMGNTPGSVQSGRGIIALQQRVDIRNTPLLKEHARAISQVAKASFAFVQVGYEGERIVRYVGENGQMRHTPINQLIEEAQRINDPTTGAFDISFSVESSAPTNYVARSEQAKEWALAGLMGPITAINRSDLPNKQEAVREALAMSGNPLLVIHAVTSGILDQDDPLVQMVLAGGQGQGGGAAPPPAETGEGGPGVTDPNLTEGEMAV